MQDGRHELSWFSNVLMVVFLKVSGPLQEMMEVEHNIAGLMGIDPKFC